MMDPTLWVDAIHDSAGLFAILGITWLVCKRLDDEIRRVIEARATLAQFRARANANRAGAGTPTRLDNTTPYTEGEAA